MPDTTWTDPQGNVWTIANPAGATWVPGGIHLEVNYANGPNGFGVVQGPIGLAPQIIAGGFDIRTKITVPPGTDTSYWQWAIGTPGQAPWTFEIRAGLPVNAAVYMLYDNSGSAQLYFGPNFTAIGNPVPGDWITVRTTYDVTTGNVVSYYSTDNGASWIQVATGNVPSFTIAGNASLRLTTNLLTGEIAWAEFHLFNGTRLAEVNFTQPWGVPIVLGFNPISLPELTPTTPVIITGQELKNVTGVLIGGFPSSAFSFTPSTGVNHPDQITFTPPVMAVGVYDVELITPSGNIPAGTFRYSLIPPAGPDEVEEGPFGIPFHQGRTLCLADLDDSQIPYQLSNILDLMDHDANGIICDTVDLGYPDVREDTGVWTDADGTWDFTRFFGARGITLSGTLVDSARGTRSMSHAALVPFLNPAARPVLIYSFDNDMHFAYMKIRAQGYSGPITNPVITRWSGQWKCPDAISYDLDVQTVTIIPGVTGSFGRVYTDPQETGVITPTSGWAPNRYYPSMGGSAVGLATNGGTAQSFPIIQIFGDCVTPVIRNDTTGQTFAMVNGFEVHAGEVLVIDTRQKAVYLGTPNASRYNQVDFSRSTFWSLAPGDNHITFDPTTADDNAQAIITWQNAYI